MAFMAIFYKRERRPHSWCLFERKQQGTTRFSSLSPLLHFLLLFSTHSLHFHSIAPFIFFPFFTCKYRFPFMALCCPALIFRSVSVPDIRAESHFWKNDRNDFIPSQCSLTPELSEEREREMTHSHMSRSNGQIMYSPAERNIH